jgi:hypothetical protein
MAGIAIVRQPCLAADVPYQHEHMMATYRDHSRCWLSPRKT